NALSPLANGELPDLPAERAEVAEAFDALDRRAAREVEVKKSSQLGGRLIAAGIGVVLAIAIILALSLGGDDEPRSAATTTTTPTSTTQATTPTGDVFEILAQAVLQPPADSGSTAKGEVTIVRFTENAQYRLALQAEGLPPSSTRGSAYGVWLYTSRTEKQFLGFPDSRVGADGKLKTVSDLAPDTPTYREVLLTRETADKPTQPGTIVLRGRIITAAPASGGATAPTETTTTP
ncbi:MAG: hypothetical protein M3376_07200, partial [Actinomycetota bacterium]|nr:hypothetical protein [Actinomycetota bacterium]